MKEKAGERKGLECKKIQTARERVKPGISLAAVAGSCSQNPLQLGTYFLMRQGGVMVTLISKHPKQQL